MGAAIGANCGVDIFNSSYGRTGLASQPITHANSEGQHSVWRRAASRKRCESRYYPCQPQPSHCLRGLRRRIPRPCHPKRLRRRRKVRADAEDKLLRAPIVINAPSSLPIQPRSSAPICNKSPAARWKRQYLVGSAVVGGETTLIKATETAAQGPILNGFAARTCIFGIRFPVGGDDWMTRPALRSAENIALVRFSRSSSCQ